MLPTMSLPLKVYPVYDTEMVSAVIWRRLLSNLILRIASKNHTYFSHQVEHLFIEHISETHLENSPEIFRQILFQNSFSLKAYILIVTRSVDVTENMGFMAVV